MSYKFPWTNYHELNLDWILDTVKKLFAQTEQNNEIVTQYDSRLTEVELTADSAQTAAEQAQSDSAAALSLAQGAQTTATQAQQAAATAQQAAGQAQTAAGQAQEASATAQQTATQAQQTAQNFDGRITQAENNAASALQAAQAFDEQVQGAITAANNANTAATNAVNVAAEANQKSDRTAAQLNAQINTITQTINSQLEAAETAIENKGEEVLESIPEDYTELSNDVSNLSGSLATVEPTSTSSKAYAVGDLLVYNCQLYKVVSAIAAGGMLNPGTNIVVATIENELNITNSEILNTIDLIKSSLVPLGGLPFIKEIFPFELSFTIQNAKCTITVKDGRITMFGGSGTTYYQAVLTSPTVHTWQGVASTIENNLRDSDFIDTPIWLNRNIYQSGNYLNLLFGYSTTQNYNSSPFVLRFYGKKTDGTKELLFTISPTKAHPRSAVTLLSQYTSVFQDYPQFAVVLSSQNRVTSSITKLDVTTILVRI